MSDLGDCSRNAIDYDALATVGADLVTENEEVTIFAALFSGLHELNFLQDYFG